MRVSNRPRTPATDGDVTLRLQRFASGQRSSKAVRLSLVHSRKGCGGNSGSVSYVCFVSTIERKSERGASGN